MSKIYIALVLAITVLFSGSTLSAKEYKAPLIATFKHSAPAVDMVPGDEIETTVTFQPLMDFKSLEVRIIPVGTELVSTADVITLENLTKNTPVEVTFKVRLIAENGRISINYFAKLPYEDAFGALNICCYGKVQ